MRTTYYLHFLKTLGEYHDLYLQSDTLFQNIMVIYIV